MQPLSPVSISSTSRPFAGLDGRSAWLRAILLGACFLSLLASAPAWLNAHPFPLLPIAAWFPVLPAPWDSVYFALMLLSLAFAGWCFRPAVIFFLVAGFLAFCEDQNRGQPWFYLYWVMLLLNLLPPPVRIAACRWALSAAYIWSGLQKCQSGFFNRVPAWFVAPAEHWHLPAGAINLLRWAVACAPFVELGIGLGVWVPRFRRAAIAGAVGVHLTALLFLGPLGYNYDLVVWPWNLAMIALVYALFWRAPDVRVTQTFTQLRRSKPALFVLALFSFLPILSFAGWWDSYFSFSLYSENQSKADIFLSQTLADSFPPQLRRYVHPLRQAYDPRFQGPFVFDFQAWGYDELRVPPILEPRNYRSIFAFLRRSCNDSPDLRMIIAPRRGPMIFYQANKRWRLEWAKP